jgi:hypothetical protein
MTEKIQCSLYGETMVVRCNNKTKHASNIIELSCGYSQNRDKAKCANEQILTLCCSTYSCLHLLSCRQSPITFETDRVYYETGFCVGCLTVSSSSSRGSHTKHLVTLATVLQSLGTYRAENTATVLT